MSFWKKLLGGDFDSNRAEGDEHFDAHRFGEAKLAYERAIDKAKPEDASRLETLRVRIRDCRAALAEVQATRAQSCLEQGEVEAAIEALESAIEVSDDPDARERYRKRIDEMHAVDARMAAEAPGEASDDDRYEVLSAEWEDDQIDEYERYGERFRSAYLSLHESPSEDSVARALETLRDLAREHEGEARYVFLEIGRAELRLGKREEGIESLRRFLASLPEDVGEVSRVHAHFALADTYLDAKDEAAAQKQLEAAAEAVPDLTAGHLRLGQFLRSRGKHEEAARALAEAARTMGEIRPDVRVIREIGLNQIGLGREDEAIETLESVVQLQAAHDSLDLDPQTAIALAGLYEKRGDPGHAADLFRHLVRGSDVTNHFAYHRQAARLLLAAGKTATAREHLVKARELAPDDAARESLDELSKGT
ncbi:MAG: tetratricopeptide repeat protein [Deltaproteobacteria bacterium]|nr:tetratricopeptide repeat protein [Deltaproteobacteria bacterium]